MFALFFNCEEAAVVASTYIEGHALTSCILLLSVAVAVAAVMAASPSVPSILLQSRPSLLVHSTGLSVRTVYAPITVKPHYPPPGLRWA